MVNTITRQMKDSGIDWIGEIPKEWEINKIGAVYEERNTKVSDKDYEPLSVTKKGILPQLENAAKTDHGDNRKLVKVGDFVINSRSDRRGSCGISPLNGSVSLINTVLKPRSNINNHFYNFVFKSECFADEFYRWGNGIVDDLWSTKWSNMKNIYIPFPELQLQEKIANYLDEKCLKIDEIIEKEKDAIEKLKEYKKSIITEAITKGLDHNVPMRSSNIDWIGKVPEHWKLKKIKYEFRIKKDIAGKEGYDVLSVTQAGIKIKDISNNEGQMAMDYSKYQLVNIDDYVMNHMDLLTGYMDCSKYSGVTSPDYRVFYLINKANSKHYFKNVFQTCYKNKIFYGLGQGVSGMGRWRLQSDKFLNFVIPIPPIDEQFQIVVYIDQKSNEVDRLIQQKEQLIKKLTEYKKSHIYECVTGKRLVV